MAESPEGEVADTWGEGSEGVVDGRRCCGRRRGVRAAGTGGTRG